MSKKPTISFFDFMQHYPQRTQGRKALAANMEKLSNYHPELMTVNSFVDLLGITTMLTDTSAARAISASLWCEYCAISGREFFEEFTSNEHKPSRRKKHLE